MSKQNRLILIDGSGYIFRAYYALPPMTKNDGTPINALYGFTNMLINLIENYGNEKLIVIFDAARENFRNKIYSEYKSNRGETPEDLIPQFDLIKKCVKAFNVPQLEIQGFEADDIIATYTNLAKKNNFDSLIISSDKDLMQLVNENVSMLDPIKNKSIGIEEVKNKFGVIPGKVVEVQALMGDRIDNIPGAPGIGPKTASELISKFGNIENLIKNSAKIKQDKKRKIIEEHKKNIRLSLELVTLKNDVKLPISIKEICPYDKSEQTQTSITNFLIDQEFKTILNRLKNSFINIPIDNYEQKPKIEAIYKTISKIDDLKKLIKQITESGICAIDTETDSLNINNVNLVGISICFENNKAYYIPLSHKELKTNKLLKNQINFKDAMEEIKKLCSDSSILKIGQNIKYDIRVLKKYGVKLESISDTMLMSYAFENGITRHNLDDLAQKHLNIKTIKFKDVVGTGKKQITFDYVDINQATKYASEDALITFNLYNLFSKKISTGKHNFIYQNIDKPLIEVLASMEEKGIKIDNEYLKKLSREFSKEINILEEKIFTISKTNFNIGSPKQLGEVLFGKMQIKGGKKTKSGTFSTDSNTLEEIASHGEKIAKYILSWRELSKLRSTYSEALVDQISKTTKRVHTSYANATTITGRLSSNDPNLQNIPIRTENGRKIRKAFIAEKGYNLVSFDYSQIELRLAAEISKDQNFIKAFKDGEDIHSKTASEIFSIKIKDLNSDHRRKAKAINFGIIYGISPYGLAKQLSITNSEGKNYIENYFKRFPKIKEYMENQTKFCKKNLYVETLFGRRCYIRGINDKNFSLRGFSERQSINAPIQGTAADIIKIAMNRIHEEINNKIINAKMLLQVHDELVFEIENKEKKSIEKIKTIMENSHKEFIDFKVPLVVDYKIGFNWGESN
ncbi:MAG: DNA polymerase I [Alphaproteobacteria bacterium MarineAlpha5_Bin12]|nr:MAG: DNA polymerase I [Alphaproteobacteria bacterium MarineAlpha5_Bin12]|tara:strand:+ start:6864 stop:9602 length:2739 start_codon:yes stop_codon:yes gene_type:complete